MNSKRPIKSNKLARRLISKYSLMKGLSPNIDDYNAITSCCCCCNGSSSSRRTAEQEDGDDRGK